MAFQLKRRTLFAAGAGALAAPSLLAGLAGAQETTEKGGTAMSADFRTLKLGSFKVTVISDGTRAADKPHEIFGTNQPADSVSKLLEENFLPTSGFVNGFFPGSGRYRIRGRSLRHRAGRGRSRGGHGQALRKG